MKNKSEIFVLFFEGRYIVLLMGIFSFYTGFIYNDIFSKSMNIFGPQWYVNLTNVDHIEEVDLLPKANYRGSPYVFGIDPIWQVGCYKIFRIHLTNYSFYVSCINYFNFRFQKTKLYS